MRPFESHKYSFPLPWRSIFPNVSTVSVIADCFFFFVRIYFSKDFSCTYSVHHILVRCLSLLDLKSIYLTWFKGLIQNKCIPDAFIILSDDSEVLSVFITPKWSQWGLSINEWSSMMLIFPIKKSIFFSATISMVWSSLVFVRLLILKYCLLF